MNEKSHTLQLTGDTHTHTQKKRMNKCRFTASIWRMNGAVFLVFSVAIAAAEHYLYTDICQTS